MEQALVVGQRVAVNWDGDRGERWVGTVVDPARVEIHGQATMALVEWECATEGEEWFPGRHRQIHPHHELELVATIAA